MGAELRRGGLFFQFACYLEGTFPYLFRIPGLRINLLMVVVVAVDKRLCIWDILTLPLMFPSLLIVYDGYSSHVVLPFFFTGFWAFGES